MNGKDILEGFGHIDERYIQEAETATKTKRMTGWVRILPHAACFALLAFIGFQQLAVRQPMPHVEQADPTAATQRDESNTIPVSFHNDSRVQTHAGNPGTTANRYNFTADYISIDADAVPVDASVAMYIRDAEQLQKFRSGYGKYIASEEEKRDAFGKYDDAFFAQNDLIALVLTQSDGANGTVEEVSESRGTVTVTVQAIETASQASGQVCILIEVSAGKQLGSVEKLKISILDGGNET